MKIKSTAFGSGAEIPRKYGFKKGNISPPLSISRVPEQAKSLAIIMDDPDAMKPAGKVWVHWLLWNLSAQTSKIDEGVVPAGANQGKTDFGKSEYGGPAPPDKRHKYVFKLYALDTILDLKAGSPKKKLLEAMEGHILSEAALTGTYAP